MSTVTDRSNKWKNRLNEGYGFKRAFWWVVYGSGRIFSAMRWKPFSEYTFSLKKKSSKKRSTKKRSTKTLLSKLEQLPHPIAQDEVAPSLDKKDLSNIVQTSKTSYRMFQKPLRAAKLLHFVQEANYDKAQEMIEADPLLMFQYVSYKKTDGSYETISPLKFAFKMLDTYMWKMFYDKIKNDPECIKNPKLFLERFTKQALSQTEHVDLEALFVEYRTYDEKYAFWSQKRKFDVERKRWFGQAYDELKEVWVNIGWMQRNVLPRHMLKEFCRKGEFWCAKSNFDVKVEHPPTRIDVCINSHKGKAKASLASLISGLGCSFSLIRGQAITAASGYSSNIRPEFWLRDGCVEDAAIFGRLCEVRKNDLDEFRSQLTPATENTNKMK